MKIQVTNIEAGQTIKVASLYNIENELAWYQEELKQSPADEFYKAGLKEVETHISLGVTAHIKTNGKHNLELKVLEVKDCFGQVWVNLGNRNLGSNYALLVTDKGTFLAANRNKVTLVD